MDLTSSNAIQTRYLAGTAANDWLARQDSSGNTYWYQTDRLGSVIGVTNSSGTMVDTSPMMGLGISCRNRAPPTVGICCSRECGSIVCWDGTTMTLGPYTPSTGDFRTQDLRGFNGGSMNLYESMENEPTNRTDPTGQASENADRASPPSSAIKGKHL